MAVEPKRGCGYRKVHGLYLVGGGIGVPCDRLPFELLVCSCCGQGIKQALGWTWIDVAKFFNGQHNDMLSLDIPCRCAKGGCPLCAYPESMGKAGLLWIGEKFYKTPQHFIKEGTELGFSRRIKAVPHKFKVGETWIMLAHSKAVSRTETIQDADGSHDVEVFKPGIFYVWLPQRVEKICVESDRDNTEEMDKLSKRGITPVFVPDDDPDHQGNVHDDFEKEKKGE
jgi:hypothetical protein